MIPTRQEIKAAIEAGRDALQSSFCDDAPHFQGDPPCDTCDHYYREAVKLSAMLETFDEREDFLEAAMLYGAWCDTSSREVAEIDTSKTFAWINRLGELQHEFRAAYRRLAAKRKGASDARGDL